MRSLLVALTLALSLPATAQDADKEAAYTRSIEKRAQDAVSPLNLNDAAKSARVRDAIVAQYRALRDWHDANDAKLKALKSNPEDAEPLRADVSRLKSSLKQLHDTFLARLSKDLTPEHVEQVKDKMTYNVVHVTYNAYGQMLPDLTAAQKARIMEILKEAREEAMDGGSAEEKHAVFGRYKGRINNYLAAEDYDLKKASKELAEKLKAKGGSDRPRDGGGK